MHSARAADSRQQSARSADSRQQSACATDSSQHAQQTACTQHALQTTVSTRCKQQSARAANNSQHALQTTVSTRCRQHALSMRCCLRNSMQQRAECNSMHSARASIHSPPFIKKNVLINFEPSLLTDTIFSQYYFWPLLSRWHCRQENYEYRR